MDKNFVILYHKDDNDGLFSMALIFKWLQKTHPGCNIKLIPSDYQSIVKLYDNGGFTDLFNDYAQVFMTDISLPAPKMMKIKDKVNFHWFDHHKPIIDASFEMGFDNIQGVRSLECSAIGCVWQGLYSGEIPHVFKMLSAYDSWTWEKEGLDKNVVSAFNTYVTYSYNLTPTSVINACDTYINGKANEEMEITQGIMLNDFMLRTQIRNIEDNGDFNWLVNNEPSVCVVTMGQTTSQFFEAFSDKVMHAICFKHTAQGWIMSLYNTSDNEKLHCGEYLKENFGGGGHKGAAGCVLTDEEFYKLMSEKKI